jgi:hypothetical protein
MSDNKKGKFLFRMLGSIITGFCREFGSENVKKMLEFIVNYEPFWELAKMAESCDPMEPPWKRGEHDFIE